MTAEAVLPFEEFVADGAPAPATPVVGTPTSPKKSDNPGYGNLTEGVTDGAGEREYSHRCDDLLAYAPKLRSKPYSRFFSPRFGAHSI